MNTVYSRIGEKLTSGKNLAVIVRYATCSPVNVVTCKPAGLDYKVTFHFDNGASCETTWADWRVLMTWLLARRTWGVNRLTFDAAMTRKVQEQGADAIQQLYKRGAVVTFHAYQS